MNHAGTPASPRNGRVTARALVMLAVVFVALAVGYAAIRPRPGVELRYFATSQDGTRREVSQERALGGPFTAELSAWLRVPKEGLYSFGVVADAPATLWVAGRAKIEATSRRRTLANPISLERGPHQILLEYRRDRPRDSAPRFEISWYDQTGFPEPVPERMLYSSTTAPWRFRAAAALPPALAALVVAWLVVFLRRSLSAPTLRTAAFATVTAVAATAVTLAALEVSLRIGGVAPRSYIPVDVASRYRFWQPGATMEYVGITPYLVQEYRTLVRYNSRGWRDRDYPLEKSPRTSRILVLGDSFVEGLNVELEETFHKRLESMLNDHPPSPATEYEVIALGRAGTTTKHQLEFFEQLGAAFEPDLVLLCFFTGNDVMEQSPELTDRFERWSQQVYYGRVVPARARFLARWMWLPGSYLNHFVVDRLLPLYTRSLHLFERDLTRDRLRAPDSEVYTTGPYDDAWARAWHATARNVEDLHRRVVASGARFLVVIIGAHQPSGLAGSERDGSPEELDLHRPSREIARICESSAIPYLDLEAPMERRRRPGERLFYEYDRHWNTTGHRLAAEAILEHLTPLLAAR